MPGSNVMPVAFLITKYQRESILSWKKPPCVMQKDASSHRMDWQENKSTEMILTSMNHYEPWKNKRNRRFPEGKQALLSDIKCEFEFASMLFNLEKSINDPAKSDPSIRRQYRGNRKKPKCC
ncbi:hypothetical protein SAY86_028313 [Trapa natans]|uniref:Uncharacterized protein n=1 Tax=Trapa natans TaxID=22666 RepID=A0AAN7M0Y1_TRANT|nr:hypothetical protein SAY86_028313 [Trapa natans]